jgi:hypothetical protein
MCLIVKAFVNSKIHIFQGVTYADKRQTPSLPKQQKEFETIRSTLQKPAIQTTAGS